MPPSNLIVNGTFENGLTGWSGTGLEHGAEDSYLENGSSNFVVELDARFQGSFLSQDFNVSAPTSTTLTLDVGLPLGATSGFEGFIVSIVDNGGATIASTVILPTSNALTSYSLPVSFPSAGSYSIRFSELGADDGIGAIVDNIAIMVVCFANGTLIETPGGLRKAETLVAGDIVTTTNGPKTIRWAGRRDLTPTDLKRNPSIKPVRIRRGALGRGLPFRDLLVSRQHRILVRSPIAKHMRGSADALVAAALLTELPGVDVASNAGIKSYHHFLFDAHEVVCANGVLCESFLPGPEGLKGLATPAAEELVSMMGGKELETLARSPAAFIPTGKQRKKIVAQLVAMQRLTRDFPQFAVASTGFPESRPTWFHQ